MPKFEENVTDEIQELKGAVEEVKKRPSMPKAVNFAYVFVLAIIIVITGFFVMKGWAEKPEISIQYNVGEIIGGILIGLGAAVAGIAYALRVRVRGE